MIRFILLILPFVLVTTHPSIVRAESAGTSNKDQVNGLDSAVEMMILERQIAGAVVLVSHKGRIIHHNAYGLKDIEDKEPMKKDSIFRIYSMTKPITSTAVMILAERGLVDLDAPVHHYIPQLRDLKVHGWKKRPPKTPVTIRHLLTHTAGLTYGFFSNTMVDKGYMKNHPLYSKSNQDFIDKLSQHPLLYQPGKKWHYSVATDVLGHLVEAVSGQPLDVFFTENIFDPLDMTDTAFVLPVKKTHRFASSYGSNLKLVDRYKGSKFSQPKRIKSGGGGLTSTAQDYLRFCQMLLNEGELNGKRILSADTVREMTGNQLPKGVYAYRLFGFGYGFQVQLSDWGDKFIKGEYGWNGAASTHFWIVPSKELIVIALSQRQPFSNALKKKIKPLIYKQIGR